MTPTEKEKELSPRENQRCKVCGKKLPRDTAAVAAPFCSERCRLNDLSKWFGEKYRIASHSRAHQEDDSDEGQES